MPDVRSSRSLRIVASHSAIAGLCPLIPAPFVDDLVIRRVVRRMHASLFAARGLELSPAGARALSATPTAWVRGAATSMALFPIKKVLKKVVYLLAIKDCADVASTVFHDGWLLARLLERGADGHALTDPKYLRRVRKAMLKTYQEIDPAPLRRALVGSLLGARVGAEQGLRAVQRLLKRRDPDAPIDEAPAEVEKLSSRMRTAAMREWQYLEALERRFHRHLGLAAAPAAAEARRGA